VTGEIRILAWFFLILVVLKVLQQRLHFEIQACFLLITRRADLALALFSILFFPGVLLHELSHFVVAKILGVRTGRISLLPEMRSEGKLRMGYVETGKTDIIRDALIGLAPLAMGVLIITVILVGFLDFSVFTPLPSIAGFGEALKAVQQISRQPDFWAWFYLIFVISSTMFPSESDRRAWFPLSVVALLLVALGLLMGIGPWLQANLVPGIASFFQVMTVVLGACLVIHAGLLIPFWVIERLLSRLTAMRVT
jgi:hypothetical protein